jgi:hypothetical protein
MCPHTTVCESSYCYICVLKLLYMQCALAAVLLHVPPPDMCVSSYCNICVLILLYMCPHTAIYLYSYYSVRRTRCASAASASSRYACPHTAIYMCPNTAICVSSYCYMCVLICSVRRTRYASAASACSRYVSSYCCICVHTAVCGGLRTLLLQVRARGVHG